MIVNDPVYGKFNINDQVLIQIIKSRPMQRLKGVNQFGQLREEYGLPFYSRYEHSVGVMLLLRRLGANLEEQVAGLIHDVSHTVFSHTIDIAFGDHTKEDYQDNTHREYVNSTVLPKILSEHGLSPDGITNIENYLLLERPLPGLCADRVDYTLRCLKHATDPEVVDNLVSDLVVVRNEIMFKSREQARIFGVDYFKSQNIHWAEPLHVARAYLLADVIRDATAKGIISAADFYKTDAYIIDRVRNSKDGELNTKLHMLDGEIKLKIVKRNPDYVLRAKRRYVDPKFVENGRVYMLSKVDPAYKKLIEKQSELIQKGIMVRVSAY